jgi:hypothetical protein
MGMKLGLKILREEPRLSVFENSSEENICTEER